MKKYLHIVNSLKIGGISTFIKDIVKLNSKEKSTHYIAVYGNLPKDTNKFIIDISFCKRNILKTFIFAYKSTKQYEKIFIHNTNYLLTFAYFFFKGKYYIFQHGMAVSSGGMIKKGLKKLWFTVIPILLNAKVIFSSEYAYNKMLNKGIKISSKRKRIIYFGTSMERKTTIKKKVITEKVIIGTAGRLAKIKRFDKLILSLKEYSGNIKINLLIAGNGPEKDKLLTLANSINNPLINVKLIGNVKDMKSFYDNIDFFVFPSHNESFGLVVIEALFRNTPVVVVEDLGGAISLIKNGYNGFIVAKVEDIIDKLISMLLLDKNLLSKLSKNIAKTDLSKYQIEKTRFFLENMD